MTVGLHCLVVASYSTLTSYWTNFDQINILDPKIGPRLKYPDVNLEDVSYFAWSLLYLSFCLPGFDLI